MCRAFPKGGRVICFVFLPFPTENFQNAREFLIHLESLLLDGCFSLLNKRGGRGEGYSFFEANTRYPLSV